MQNIKDFLNVSDAQIKHARELHKDSIVVDNAKMGVEVWSEAQVEKLNEMMDRGRPYCEIEDTIRNMRLEEMLDPDSDTRRIYAAQIQKSGVTCTSLTQSSDTMEGSLRSLSRMHRLFENLEDIILFCSHAGDILKAKREGKIAVMLDFQNTLSIGMDLDNIDLFYDQGIRQIQLTYNLRTLAADGGTERTNAGLSHFGVAMIQKMNDLGIIVDTGHVGIRSTIEAAEVSQKPIAISHSCCRTVHAHDRCKTDDAIKAVAARGGVIGMCAIPYFLAPIYKTDEGNKAGTLKDMLDHIDYAVELAGIDHVGIGTDTKDRPGCPERWGEAMRINRENSPWKGWRPEHTFDYDVNSEACIFPSPDKILAWSNWVNITIGLVSRGYSDEEIRKIIGENWLRLYKEVIGEQ